MGPCQSCRERIIAMSKYTGKAITVPRSVDEVYAKVSDLSQYSSLIEQLPESQRSQLSGVKIEGDTVRMDAPSIGQLSFKIAERVAPSRVSFEAEGAPVPLLLSVDLRSVEEGKTSVTPTIDINIPAMLRPFIGGKIQEAADRFGDIFTTIFK